MGKFYKSLETLHLNMVAFNHTTFNQAETGAIAL
jgi:hypothetical protein